MLICYYSACTQLSAWLEEKACHISCICGCYSELQCFAKCWVVQVYFCRLQRQWKMSVQCTITRIRAWEVINGRMVICSVSIYVWNPSTLTLHFRFFLVCRSTAGHLGTQGAYLMKGPPLKVAGLLGRNSPEAFGSPLHSWRSRELFQTTCPLGYPNGNKKLKLFKVSSLGVTWTETSANSYRGYGRPNRMCQLTFSRWRAILMTGLDSYGCICWCWTNC